MIHEINIINEGEIKIGNAPFKRELVQIDLVFRGSDEINELPYLSSVCNVVHQLEEIDVVAFSAEMNLQQVIDSTLQHE